MMSDKYVSSLGNAWRVMRDDVNVLAWLFEEQRVLQRLYLESAFYAITGKSFSLDEFAKEVGFGVADQGTADDPERPAKGALE